MMYTFINISVMCYHEYIKKIQYSILHAYVVVLFLWRVIITASFRDLMNNLCGHKSRRPSGFQVLHFNHQRLYPGGSGMAK